VLASPPEPASPRAARARLTVEDWVDAGFALIAGEGLRAVKIDRLCARLGVTKGSFYWHFEDLGAYLDALADAWGRAQRRSRAALRSLRPLPPSERLTGMMRHLTAPRQWTLERAVREWARADTAVAAQVRAADRSVFREVRAAFLDAGFDAREADVRARAAFAAGIGFIHLATSPPGARDAAEHERFLQIMLQP
jgi:AcrR family transcriptional regulator